MVKAYIMPSVGNPPNSLNGDQRKEAEAVAQFTAGMVEGNLIDKQYPCLQVLSAMDAEALLENERLRELLGSGDPAALESVAGALGADYVISVSATATGSGQYAFSGSMMNGSTGKLVAHSATGPSSGDVTDAMDAFARQFTDGLASVSGLSNKGCIPTNAWTGTVIYSSERETTSHPPVAPLMHATRVYDKNEETDQFSARTEVTFHVPWNGPVKATVKDSLKSQREINRQFRASCKAPGNWQARTVSNGASKHLEVEEYNAGGEGSGTVTVSFDQNNLVLQLGFPPPVDGIFTRHVTDKTSGGCPGEKPDDLDVSSTGPTQSPSFNPVVVRVPADPKSDTQTGTYTLVTGAKVEWHLTRTPLKK
jgi:hypothetical protein